MIRPRLVDSVLGTNAPYIRCAFVFSIGGNKTDSAWTALRCAISVSKPSETGKMEMLSEALAMRPLMSWPFLLRPKKHRIPFETAEKRGSFRSAIQA